MTHLVVALLQGLLRKTFPALRSVNTLGRLESDVEITTLYRKVEAGVFILHEVQRDLLCTDMSAMHRRYL